MKIPKVGELAPSFEGITDEGKTISLQDFTGKTVVLFFYPAAESPGCTVQACSLRDIYEELLELGTEVIGVSVDSEEAQNKFKARRKLPYHLIADETKEISKQYGGIGRMGKSNRITFLIDESGVIRKIWKLTGIIAQLRLSSHGEEVKKAVLSLKE